MAPPTRRELAVNMPVSIFMPNSFASTARSAWISTCSWSFEVALDDLDAQPDLVNQVLEISLQNSIDEDIRVVRYALPDEG